DRMARCWSPHPVLFVSQHSGFSPSVRTEFSTRKKHHCQQSTAARAGLSDLGSSRSCSRCVWRADEGSSEMSDSTDDDDDDGDEDDDSEAELEAERLWRSLCHSEDPYDPRNFTARLHTGVTTSRAIPVSTSPSSAQSSPSSSPPSSMDTWDDSASASEADEESLRLWDSFSSSSDPFNPLNFQAPIRTRESATARAGKTSAYRRFRQESPPNSASCEFVCFLERHDEKLDLCGEEEEDRRGPWEELARDRCRFLRRCQEVEESIAYCLQPQHRRRVYEQLAALPR
uniref:Protein phosphatase 1 regulatory subunit 15A/B C-terminal domain-containing protein n=1 Tax=Oreochromis aureus TaxID=47969 RepID=A0A668RR72_OREAU